MFVGWEVLAGRMAQRAHNNHAGIVRAIGFLKLLKGLALVALGLGALKLMHQDLTALLQRLLEYFHFDPDNRYFETAFRRISKMNPGRMTLFAAGTFFYAGLFLTEGVGLLLRKRWAEYFTVIVTASFIPLEIYELIRHFNALKILVVVINVAIIIYLILRLKAHKE